MPGSRYLVRITGNNLTTNTIITSMFITVVLSLIVLASDVALAAIVSLFVAATSTYGAAALAGFDHTSRDPVASTEVPNGALETS
ncbi:hypothetical protein FJTKL_12211 [Diaporthe vaccinii]|uniref:Uncharacterized protein n=1 Tax=Diaporthe vaccinii TaxID=105482 RepID=A0ABR4EF45_9PEZI